MLCNYQIHIISYSMLGTACVFRDSRYGVSRTPPLSVDEQKRIQQYNQMISSRNMPQSTMSVPGSLSGSDLGGVRMLPGGNGMGMLGWD